MSMVRLMTISLLTVMLNACEGGKANNSIENNTVERTSDEQAITASPQRSDLPIDRITLPQGFKMGIYADSVEGARSMDRGAKGTLFVGTRDDKVYALVDADNDYYAEKVYTIASGLDMPNGVAFRDGSLYVAEVSRVLRYDNIEDNLNNPPKPVVVSSAFPSDKHHGWKYIAFGPDGKLYVPVGAPCNVCEVDYNKYENIMRMNPDGSQLEVYAKGVRNTVGFDWNPSTSELWFTDNGRDMLGDNIPADELNYAPMQGIHFGFPYCHAGDIIDPKFGKGHNCSDYTAPAIKLGPHVAALGMKFYDGDNFPADYRNKIFIAEHGSWNRTTKIGYRVMMVTVENGEASNYEPFATGWLQGSEAWGRPVDIFVLDDGSMLVSDDAGGAVYRIWYTK